MTANATARQATPAADATDARIIISAPMTRLVLRAIPLVMDAPAKDQIIASIVPRCAVRRTFCPSFDARFPDDFYDKQ